MKIVTLDMETYFDKEYTLSSGDLNTSEYIRDERFKIHGVGIKIGDKPAKWYSGSKVETALRKIDWPKHALLCHHTQFDGFILHEHFGIHPAYNYDTLSMSRIVHGHSVKHNLDELAKRHGLAGKIRKTALESTKGKLDLTPEEDKALGEYCCDDVEDTYKAFMAMEPHVPDKELDLIDITIRMFTNPVLLVDLPRVQAELEREVGGKAAALFKTGVTADQLMSNKKFAALLESRGVQYLPLKISPATGLQTYAFARGDAEFRDFMSRVDKDIKAICDARIAIKSTIGETRAVRFLRAGADGKPLPVYLNHSGAHTHRWSGGNKLNLQNLKRGGELRKSLLAPEGMVVAVRDSSQIEARITAWLAGEKWMVDAFRSGEDVYKLMASRVYNVPVEQVTKDQRFLGKILILALGYGMGATKLQATLDGYGIKMTHAECQVLIKTYRKINAKIVSFWDACNQVLASMVAGQSGNFGPIAYGKNFIRLPDGLFMQYPGMHGDAREVYGELVVQDISYLTRNGRGRLYGGLFTENLAQALARCIIAEQMRKIAKRYRIVTMSHDEIVVICPEHDAEACMQYMDHVMSTSPYWAQDLPLKSEGGYAREYSK